MGFNEPELECLLHTLLFNELSGLKLYGSFQNQMSMQCKFDLKPQGSLGMILGQDSETQSSITTLLHPF